ncbi:glycosyltransferase family 2 protein [Couchioplanes caeruleus]|uniref:glycosyltransferase family 2 protein n=1 Tax=Couchioplanes caeruleus TaxID=56438 RepID=UPI0020C0D67F|nr:glycosyltransferase family 2 protein [Couchioplanes caeruleus]UQU62870.1 glycosyltransferase family 2 protein [Couchioplanes caeruleus]
MVVLLPVYQPGEPLLTLIGELGAARVVVVDDGSGPAATGVLERVAGLGCTVLRHPVNRGKGAALKTGFRHIAEAYPAEDVVCADADGQHRADEVHRVAERVRGTGRMVLGVRSFAGMPLRSRIGNTLTCRLFEAVTGRLVRDTQTGLRGYPGAMLGWLTSVPGERFEYEMNVLLEAARLGNPIDEVTIATTYLDDNASSHFAVVADATRIYWPMLRFAASRAGKQRA